MKPLTENELYEYRIKYIVRKTLDELGLDVKQMDGDQLAQTLWEHTEVLGRFLVNDMYEWTAEDDWYGLVMNG